MKHWTTAALAQEALPLATKTLSSMEKYVTHVSFKLALLFANMSSYHCIITPLIIRLFPVLA